MTPDPFTLTEEDRVKTAVQHLLRAGIRHVPIVREGRLVGIVTDRDLRRVLPSVDAGASPEQYQAYMKRTMLKDIMTADPVTCAEDAELVDVVRIFAERKFGAIPVVQGDRLVAILTQIDILRAFLDILEQGTPGD
jgi:acetoin utilization protein AcuB